MMDGPTAPRMDYVSLLRRVAAHHWKLILVTFVAVSIPVAVWALAIVPKTYEAKATIFIEDTTRGGPALIRDWTPPSDASFQIAILRSRSLAEGVVESLSRQATEELLGQSMHRDYLLEVQNAVRRLLGHELIVYSPQQRALAELQRTRVQFNALLSGEVEIRTVAYQPRVAMELANAYVEVLQARSRSYAREEARVTREFIENFLSQTKTALQESEEAAAKFQRGKGTISISQRSGLELTKLAQMENTLADIDASKEIAKVRLNYLKGGKDITGRPIPVAARLAVQQLRERLAHLEERLAALLERYTEQHPQVAATQGEIKQVQGNLSAALQSLQDPKPGTQFKLGAAERAAMSKQMADLEVEISSLEAKEEVLKQRVASFSRNLSTFSQSELEGLSLVRKVETQRNLYSLLSERLGTARIQEQAEARGLRVIDLASLPASPSSSPVNKRILLGIFMGLGLGMGVAALIEYFNRPVETVDAVAQLTGLPVLGWLPAAELRELKNGGGLEPLNFVEGPTPRALPAEGCRSIRTSLESLSRRQTLRTMMVTSPGPREGKSTILLNLGWTFWELGQRVIVVDTDLRRPALHRAIRSQSPLGLGELLSGKATWDQVQRPMKDDLIFVPAGTTKVTNPGAVLRAENIRQFLDVVQDRADLVLFDSAPVLAVSDNLILASMVDGVILVVRAGHTQQRDLLRAQEQLERVGATILGIVLNQVPPRETRRYYAPYADYYGVGDVILSEKSPWNPLSWWRPRHPKGNGKGATR